MTSQSQQVTSYLLLREQDELEVRERLIADHPFFYHGTVACHLMSIKELGIDPAFESEDSAYFGRVYEPPRVMRYCTEACISLARSASETRAQTLNSEPVLLRVTAQAVLTKGFGLDHSFSALDQAVRRALDTRDALTADEFVTFVQRYGSVSSYQPVPPAQIEFQHGGDWIPLESLNLP